MTPEPARPGDLDALLAARDAAAVWMQARGIATWRPGEMPRERVATRIERGQVFVVREGERIVASVTLMDEDTQTWGERGGDGSAGYIHMLLRDRRRTAPGSGGRLLGWAEEVIAGWGRRLSRLDTVSSNPALLAYYRARAYRPVGSHHVPGHPSLPVTLLEKRLTGATRPHSAP